VVCVVWCVYGVCVVCGVCVCVWCVYVVCVWCVCVVCVYIYIDIPDTVQTVYELPLLPNNTVSETFLHKSRHMLHSTQ